MITRNYLVMYRIGAINYKYASITAINSKRAYRSVRAHFAKDSTVFVYKTGVIWGRTNAAQADIKL